MARRSLCAVTLAVLASLLLQALPAAPVRAQEGPTRPDVPTPIESPLPPAPQPITVPPLDDPHLPSLSLRLQTEPQWAAVGEVITATITVFNTAPDAAEELVLALPLPADARAAAKDPAATATGWIWPLGTLKPGAQATVTATLQLDQVPVGEALILQPAALARGLVLPVATTGGALVTTTPESKPGPAPTTTRATRDVQGQPPLTPAPQPGPPSDSGTVRFTPGQCSAIMSIAGR